jgi:DNA-binding NtrC family response regulator
MSQPVTILLVEDERDLREIVAAALSKEGHEVLESRNGEEALNLLKKKKVDLLVSDVVLGNRDGLELLQDARRLQPLLPVVLMSGYGTIRTAVEAMKLGACDFLPKPFELDELRRTVQEALENHRQESAAPPPLKAATLRLSTLVGGGAWKAEITRIIERVAPSRATVLLSGESGTGKELVARAIHANSARHKQPFIPVACGALPRDLLESELFGHEKGAFTGAAGMKPGRFELADGGTIFLDEIGDFPVDLQVKLLRALQEREFERIGGIRSIKVDVRVLAATHRNLEEAVREGKFREDLFYRLRVIEIHLPPLREKKEDIPLLAEHFLTKFSRENGKQLKTIDRKAVAGLLAYNWPGNARELENAIEHAVVLASPEAEVLSLDLLPASVVSGAKPAPARKKTKATSRKTAPSKSK